MGAIPFKNMGRGGWKFFSTPIPHSSPPTGTDYDYFIYFCTTPSASPNPNKFEIAEAPPPIFLSPTTLRQMKVTWITRSKTSWQSYTFFVFYVKI